MMRLLAVFLLLLRFIEASQDALTITDTSCNNWDLSFSYSCGGSSGECQLGDKLEASGTVDVTSSFTPQDVTVKLKLTTFKFTVYEFTKDICELIKSDGVECGEAGTYSFETDVDIPDENSYLMSFTGSSVQVTVVIGNLDTCYGTVNKVTSSSTMSMVAASAVIGTLLVGAVAYGIRRKRRTIQDENLKKTLTDFEMAPDISARAVQV